MPDTFKNSYKVQEKELMSLSVYNVGLQKCESLYQWGPGVRDHFLIHYIVSGSGCYKTGDRIFTLRAGDCFLVYPDTEISYQADEADPWEYYWVGFSGNDALPILESTPFTRNHPILRRHPEGERIQKSLYRIYKARGNTLDAAVRMTGQLYLALSVLMEKTAGAGSSPGKSSYVKMALDYISSHFSYPISIEDIAAYAGVSRSHLYREFRSFLNCSPKEYLSGYRISRACQLLKTTDLSVTAVANSVGFDNSLYFSKAFHKIKGVSPTVYRVEHGRGIG
ncbi:AraC family transcriptional regulator [Anaerolentibacter hominis]|uniref:AraC family transcriptional regulator n=1 Tax=Anaerolentibacter hominis TaxID=3079009 RepID=UPI0031B8383A